MQIEKAHFQPGEERNSYLLMDSQHTKVPRVFHTFMTDSEFADKGILVAPAGISKSVSRWFSYEKGLEQRNASILHPISPHSAFLQHGKAHDERRMLIEKINARIAEIREIAVEEDVPFSEQSVANAGMFLEDLQFTMLPSVFLVENGNIRFVWNNAQNEQAAFQIKADQKVAQYVIFRANGDGGFDQILGSMSFKNVYSFLEGLKLVRSLIGGSITYDDFT